MLRPNGQELLHAAEREVNAAAEAGERLAATIAGDPSLMSQIEPSYVRSPTNYRNAVSHALDQSHIRDRYCTSWLYPPAERPARVFAEAPQPRERPGKEPRPD